uniref:G_PROTEIN_RECEP_F1_2 domain-containing protein n=1 Tax=Heterorhabditis bacteriophora TaxID=37862 RepID=A0A1I7WFK1_HETBA
MICHCLLVCILPIWNLIFHIQARLFIVDNFRFLLYVMTSTDAVVPTITFVNISFV